MAEDDINIVSALSLVGNKMKLRSKTNEVLKASQLDYDPNRKQVIGGDTTDFSHDRHPAIIIEKNGDQMSKIIVRCPCGRHSELVCEYENEVGDAVEAQEGELESLAVEAQEGELESQTAVDQNEEELPDSVVNELQEEPPAEDNPDSEVEPPQE